VSAKITKKRETKTTAPAKRKTTPRKPRKKPPVKKPASRGRPKAKFDYNIIKGFASIGCNDSTIADMIGVSAKTFQRHKKTDLKLAEALEYGHSNMKYKLRSWQMREAEKGNTALLIFLGKNVLGQSDRIEGETTDDSGLDKIATILEGAYSTAGAVPKGSA
jgi:hypothetical protein